MMQIDSVEIDGRIFQFFKSDLGNAPLLFLKGKKGYAMCGYLNIETANKVGDIAVRVTGVKTLDDMLSAKIADASIEAQKLGIKQGDQLKSVVDRL
ncbi:DUF1805 domain-containing protein [Thermoplasma sp. Kam2015]|uniref:YunC family protein n=1 Tax=Thermoplasma sp. Kam2015 TaxID=2094122 RepID=UPI000D9B2042|nr:YunC family protein [Thermoplasma sp. Kam2015]PYB67858.1 DUF1805 domain-containing protein [Thermoplasma sp. Kam2015]